MSRRKTMELKVGNVEIGGDNPISVQSMTNTDTRDIKSTINQIIALEKAKCDIVRVAIPDIEAAKAIREIKKETTIPVIGDIQFDYRLAIESVDNGIDGLRINPGNIGSIIRVKEVVKACQERNIPIRIGVNSGSISKRALEKYEGVNENSMVYSALEHIKILEDMNYTNIKISLKATSVPLTIKSYLKMAEYVDYPFHLGITEAGPIWNGTVKSSVGIGALLAMGVGDTIRVSLTGDPVEEVRVGREILKSLNLLEDGIQIISCPTCGRTQINLVQLVEEVQSRLDHVDKPIKLAIMGCAVNGPGEAREADIGIAGGNGCGLIFKKGKIIKKVSEEKLIDELVKEVENI
ncbi:flavodoxin-dependent (E)-4-hydroxy-3-methylbut-2-enyl-diphosphate synthase [Anaerosalibacter bizertensis]|uniref:4-hydroxy-3-methylbut-2-en-1-yl diphosphate synthase (flavodoxin) n=1 Tax=Anaerosalibacter bizertensis TaxID=932217 RepID=A0A9Q4ABJ2_9FIRM|nr:flavodoxin-dependent (E)-4-hydroxy-3-methylbut-2-enyl-diphosphate synthase [Anaerosalibacter bizertensis]MBV1818053.1 flavodoxin-dependent (E)-4-hydroxy-3-methylbut-2-enyl-diphosphate synthase [Bacteroidales bacterium MSK.15.36]MCB5558784.1 flavodoxin-dependent (E)-4-hydroxy-3-methylbut-2-enyl-diphosphate synthase [Anaerosalibacter bizertensis]MCG4564616.1 flavodoxin-dependent (E)-4-hydroxy-3-methylbut-2-enyl-diphosphate synthase [Anaerosalibacter bizertensis]MCG4582272.1 flavodoxin-dependen